uniref:Uncharacterized protein n=1 Tax=Romanomermis culicivorax TaxID=13658 RepID=A0A915IIH4_ROMCU
MVYLRITVEKSYFVIKVASTRNMNSLIFIMCALFMISANGKPVRDDDQSTNDYNRPKRFALGMFRNSAGKGSSDDTDDSEYNGIMFHRTRKDTDIAYQRRVEPRNVEIKRKNSGNDKQKGATGVPQ